LTATSTTDSRGAPATTGVLLVDKPAGISSHDAVSLVRRATGTRRVGHAGTLDPFATGLLVVLVGRATRLVDYIQGEPKVYDATIAFGHETETDDCTGAATREAESPDATRVDAGIAALTGALSQVPPSYSAKQVDGVRAYRAARKGAPLELAPARVTVHDWSVLERTKDRLVARITCSGGTYVRALARDLGRLAGSAAHLATLRRVRSGVFDVADAVTPEQLAAGNVQLRPPLDGLPDMQRQALTPAEVQRVRNGVAIAAHTDGARVALVDPEGRLLAIATRADEVLRPTVVLADD
jgi:tRNA pseudouridine55 synthase